MKSKMSVMYLFMKNDHGSDNEDEDEVEEIEDQSVGDQIDSEEIALGDFS